MSLLTIVVSTEGERGIVLQDASRSSHQALFSAIVNSAPAGVAAVEIWDSNGGIDRSRKLTAGKGAPELEKIWDDFQKAKQAQAAAVAKAQAAEAEKLEALQSSKEPAPPAKKAAKKASK